MVYIVSINLNTPIFIFNILLGQRLESVNLEAAATEKEEEEEVTRGERGRVGEWSACGAVHCCRSSRRRERERSNRRRGCDPEDTSSATAGP